MTTTPTTSQRAGDVGRRRNQRGEGERLRPEILDAVNRLLDRDGGDTNLTMRAVAREASVTAASIYLHFTDRADLVWSALAERYAILAGELRQAADGAGDDSRKQLLAQARAYCSFGTRNPGHYRLMFEVRQPAVELQRYREHPARLVAGELRTTVARCAADGYELALPPYQTAHTLLAGLHGFLSIRHALAATPPSAQLDALTRGLSDGLVDSLVPAAGVGRASASRGPSSVERLIHRAVEGSSD